MPGDVSHERRITDAAELRQAQDGPNWSCEYCGGTQRNADGACRNCAGARSEEQAERVSGRGQQAGSEYDDRPPISQWARYGDPPAPSRDNLVYRFIGCALVVAALCGGLLWALFTKRPVDVTVTSVAWTQTVSVERYKQVAEEGFDESRPSDAQNVKDLGSRVHHTVKVFDHNEVEHYTVQVEDGENCVAVERSCHTTQRTCTPNDNGTATCTGGDEVCTGGGEKCTTKYRDDPRTRDVPVYRDDPRYEDYYSWSVWRWKPERQVPHQGTTTETSWPDSEELCLNCRVGAGEKERESGRAATYKVVLVDEKGTKTFDHEPKSESEFHQYPVGSSHKAMYSIATGLDFSTTAL